MDKFTPEEYFEKRDKANRFSALVEEKRPPDKYLVTYKNKKDMYSFGFQINKFITLDQAKVFVEQLTSMGYYEDDYKIVISEILDLKD